MALAPYSILPTLIAVGVKLWWGAIEEVFKRLQPYATMAKGSVGVSHALTVEYMNSPLLATVAKAVRNSHWLLAVISLGAFGTEICKNDSSRRSLWIVLIIYGSHNSHVSTVE